MVKKNQSDQIFLNVTVRTIFGKNLRKLRKEGNIPANIYGPDFKSKSITVNYKDFIKAYKAAGETGIVYLNLEKEELPTLIKDVQKHPVSDIILHIDFRKIDLKQKVQTLVRVKIIGQSEAVTQKDGVLLTQNEKLLVEAFPKDIPPAIEVDINALKEIGQEIKVADLSKSTSYQIKEEKDKVIVSVIAHKEESIAPETVAPTPEVITEVKPKEGQAEPTTAPATEKPVEQSEKKEKNQPPAKK